ncbi:hypothetical protein L2E82_43350 [Cichorium intybus]|uniref:Uncharacterized protein n=1 Tax=Cichorium intybus TaxID=13427 RepID=A0ACB8ZMJ2_CICIN|nr:hypothetical protein L2E82_43350 [Cichorium intybus]
MHEENKEIESENKKVQIRERGSESDLEAANADVWSISPENEINNGKPPLPAVVVAEYRGIYWDGTTPSRSRYAKYEKMLEWTDCVGRSRQQVRGGENVASRTQFGLNARTKMEAAGLAGFRFDGNDSVLLNSSVGRLGRGRLRPS